MTNKQNPSYLTRIIKFLILLFLINGVIDSLYFAVQYVKQSLQNESAPKEYSPINQDEINVEQQNVNWSLVSKHYAPGIGMLYGPATYPGLNISADSQRLSIQQASKGASPARGLILGASQALGFGVRDDQTLSSVLNNLLKDTEMINYASPGQRITSNITFWHSLMKRGEKFDFAIMVNDVDLLFYCSIEPANANSSSVPDYTNLPRIAAIFFRLYDRFKKTNVKSTPPASSCQANSVNVDNAVFHMLYDINAAISFAKENKTPLVYIVPPTPYSRNVNVSNLNKDPQFLEYQRQMAPAQAEFTKRLKENPLPGVLDLSNVFDDKEQYFLDISGHLNALGNEVLAHKIIEHLGPEFFQKISRKQTAK